MTTSLRTLLSDPKIMSLRKNIELKKWKKALGAIATASELAPSSKTILIATSIGGNLNTLAFDTILGLALRSRGHDVHFSLCDGALTACMNCELNKFANLNEFTTMKAQKLCRGCSSTGKKVLKVAGFEPHLFKPNLRKLPKFWDLEIADSGAKRFLAKGRIDDLKEYEAVMKEYLHSSQVMNSAANQLFKDNSFDLVVAHHGIYVPQGNIVAAAKESKIPVVTWVQGYRKQSFLFGIGDTYHKSLLTESYDIPDLKQEEKQEIKDYLSSRDIGEKDWVRFARVNKQDSVSINVGINNTKVLLLTNVSWDAQLHYDSRIFSDMHSWIKETILWFSKNPTIDLIIRIHPAEETGRIKSRDRIADFIQSNFPMLPNNIKVVGPEEDVSTYKLMEVCSLGLIFATKAGMELAALGKPIIVAGESWIRGRGLSNDPTSKLEYFDFLDRFANNPASLKTDVEAALKFAHYFFFQKTRIVNSIRAIPFYPYLRPNLRRNWDLNDPGLFQIIREIEGCCL